MERYAVILLFLISAISAAAQNDDVYYGQKYDHCKGGPDNEVNKFALQVPIRQLEDFLNGTTVTIIPEMPAYRFRSLCPYLQKFMDCIKEIRTPNGTQFFEAHMKLLRLEIAFVCDTDIQDSLQCLGNFENRLSTECDNNCAQLAGQLKDEIMNVSMNRYNSSLVVSTGCQFVICRVKCQKQLIQNECKPSGLDAIRKGLYQISDYFKQLFETKEARFEFPEGCSYDQLRDI